MKEGDRVYSFYSHRSGTLLQIKWETAWVRWDDGQEQLVPLGSLRLLPTFQELKKAFLSLRSAGYSEPRIFKHFYRVYGPIVEQMIDSLDEVSFRVGDVVMDSRNRYARVTDVRRNIVKLQYRDGSHEWIPYRFLLKAFIKVGEESSSQQSQQNKDEQQDSLQTESPSQEEFTSTPRFPEESFVDILPKKYKEQFQGLTKSAVRTLVFDIFERTMSGEVDSSTYGLISVLEHLGLEKRNYKGEIILTRQDIERISTPLFEYFRDIVFNDVRKRLEAIDKEFPRKSFGETFVQLFDEWIKNIVQEVIMSAKPVHDLLTKALRYSRSTRKLMEENYEILLEKLREGNINEVINFLGSKNLMLKREWEQVRRDPVKREMFIKQFLHILGDLLEQTREERINSLGGALSVLEKYERVPKSMSTTIWQAFTQPFKQWLGLK